MSNSNYFEGTTENGAVVVSEVPPDDIQEILPNLAGLDPRVYRALASWAEDSHPRDRASRGIFQRNKYVTPGKVFDQMAIAYDALDDDVVGNVADTSEAMAFQKITFESEDKDQENVWNQIGADLDLDTWVRQAWRELFTVSQFYGVRWWGRKQYQVDGIRNTRKARKEFDIVVPTGIGFLDPTRIVPVNQDMFGNADLAWIATSTEMELLNEIDSGTQTDDLVRQLFVGKYTPTRAEEKALEPEDVPTERLILLNPENVWRHTLTRSPYERWAKLRLKSVFPLLDLKHQLREMDRAFLLGGINFIVLVTRGTDERPSNQAEVDRTVHLVRGQSKSPVIVSDHRINIEIITPDVSHILNREKWTVLDERILMRLWGTFQLGSESSNRETSSTLGRIIARGLTSRRHMVKRSMEADIVRATQKRPENEDFDASVKVEFAPRRMELEFDAAVVTSLQELRDRGDLSRETLLNEFNFDQDLEAQRRRFEDDRYSDTFKPVNVPFDSPNRVTPGGSGRKGGRPPGDSNDDSE